MADYKTRILADVSRFQAGMAKLPGITEKEASKAAIRLGAALEKAESQAAARAQSAAAKAAKSAAASSSGIGFAVTGADLLGIARGMKDFATAIADANNQLTDASTRTGLTIASLQGIKLAAEGSGVAFEQLEPLLNQFPKRLADVARGTGEAKVGFDRLGITQAEAQAMLADTDGGLKELLARLSEIPDAGERAAVATQLFGEAGGKLLQAGLASSSDALQVFSDQASRYGLETGPQATASAAQFQRAVAELGTVLMGLPSRMADAFGADVAQGIQDFTAGLVAAFEGAKLSGTSLVAGMTAVARAVDHLARGGSIEGLGKIQADLRVEVQALTQAARESVMGFREGQRAINELGAATKAADVSTTSLQRSTASAGKTASSTAADFERLAASYARWLAGDSLEAARDQELADLEALAARAAQLGELTAENERILAEQRLMVWEEYYTAVDTMAAESAAADAKSAQERVELARRTAAEELALAEQVRDARVSGALDSLGAAAQLADTLGQIAENTAETAEQERRAAMIRKRAAQFSAIVSTAQAVATALGTMPPPANLVMAGIVGAAGAAQVMAIQTAKYHSGGMVGDERVVTVKTGEAIVTPQGVERMGGPSGVEAVNSGRSVDDEGGVNWSKVVEVRLGPTLLGRAWLIMHSTPGPQRTATQTSRAGRQRI